MAHGQLKSSTSKTHPLTSSPKPVLPALPSSITLQDSILEPGSYSRFRPALLAAGARRQTLPMDWLSPHPLALPATTRLGALIVSDLTTEIASSPSPNPARTYWDFRLPSTLLDSHHSCLGWRWEGNMTVLQSFLCHPVHFQARRLEFALIPPPGPVSS